MNPRIPSAKLQIPLLALTGASALCVAVLGARVLWTGNWSHLGLVWNLFLAWVPLGFALATARAARRPIFRRGPVLAFGAAWLVFFPNAPYLFTDLVHLAWRRPPVFWTDLVLVLLFALTGLALGFLSLYLMQSLVTRRVGWVWGWGFVAVTAALSGVGLYIGRFLRWNSWDVLLNPVDLLRDVAHCALRLPADARPALLAALFAVFVFLAYVLLYALTHLQPVSVQAEEGVES
jgi:uncharacterized membrane protein